MASSWRTARIALALLTVGFAATAGDQSKTLSSTGPHMVETRLYDWTDTARQRPVPVKIYCPQDAPGPFPVIVFSHGLGESREGYAYLGLHWASHGYVSVHLQHQGSDNDTLTGGLGGLQQAAANPRNAFDRALDVRFALDRLEQINRDGPWLQGRLDMAHVGLAGHSFGAHTTLAVAGQGRALGAGMADARIKAAIPMSAPVPTAPGSLDKVYEGIKIPCFHMTGTLDNSPIGNTTAADRRIPYDHIRAPGQYLIVFQGGDHMIFSGRGRLVRPEGKDSAFQRLICAASTAFWNAYLKSDPEAKPWLTDGGLSTLLGRDAKFEYK